MVICMKTTINLADGLMEAAKRRAKEEGRTFTSLVEEGLRAVLSADPGNLEDEGPLPSYGDRDGPILVDLGDRDALWAALDDDGVR